jgi:putative nucleotidyltransferase with HDIG domain
MNFKKIAVSRVNEGDILAFDVYDKNGLALIAAKGTVFNNYTKERLTNLGIDHVYIYKQERRAKLIRNSNDDFTKTYINTVSLSRAIFQDLIAGKPLDFQLISSITEQIHLHIDENSSILKCLSDIRCSDEYTYIHSVNVAFYSMLIAKWLKLSDFEINKAIQSGLLHDVGKIKIPNEVLNKRGVLTKKEYDIIKNHTLLGYEIVENINGIDKDIKNAVLLHHERMDGSGYPFCYHANRLNLYSRIVAVADVFDAMTSERIYKSRSTPFDALEMFQTVGITMFDTKILNVFTSNLSSYLVGSKVLLSNGDIGEIVFIPIHKLTCPIIKIPTGYLDFSKESRVKISNMISV